MNNFYLFLDESKPNGHNINHLCLAGLIIEQETYEKEVIPAVNRLKNNVFGNTSIILHETEVRAAQNQFSILRRQEKRSQYWDELRNIFESFSFTAIASSLHINNYKEIYQKDLLNDEYFIVLQIIIENYVHFLRQNNGRGSIFIESTNPTDDVKLRQLYHKIIANGTLYFSSDAFQERLLTINFLIKNDNNVGLQLADFIPGTLNRSCNGLNPKTPSIYDIIDSQLYKGDHNHNLKDRFGFKILP